MNECAFVVQVRDKVAMALMKIRVEFCNTDKCAAMLKMLSSCTTLPSDYRGEIENADFRTKKICERRDILLKHFGLTIGDQRVLKNQLALSSSFGICKELAIVQKTNVRNHGPNFLALLHVMFILILLPDLDQTVNVAHHIFNFTKTKGSAFIGALKKLYGARNVSTIHTFSLLTQASRQLLTESPQLPFNSLVLNAGKDAEISSVWWLSSDYKALFIPSEIIKIALGAEEMKVSDGDGIKFSVAFVNKHPKLKTMFDFFGIKPKDGFYELRLFGIDAYEMLSVLKNALKNHRSDQDYHEKVLTWVMGGAERPLIPAARIAMDSLKSILTTGEHPNVCCEREGGGGWRKEGGREKGRVVVVCVSLSSMYCIFF
jgi:hypothetical protein